MPRLIIAFLLLSLVWSCRPALPTRYQKIDQKGEFKSLYFSDIETDYVYKASIAAMGRSFGGIWIIKNLGKGEHRIVMTTEFGNRIFDFLVNDSGDFKKNFVIEPLNKKVVINLLRRDIEDLIKSKFYYLYKYQNYSSEMFMMKGGNYLKVLDGKLVFIGHSKNKKSIFFGSGSETQPDSIQIKRKQFGLDIRLKKMD